MTVPLRATYRLQFSAAFGFRDAAKLAPYLAALGVSHLYASPIFAARPGSAHGYDIVDHNRLNPELGDPEDFRDMVAALRRHGLGLIVDFVPNHMGIGGDANHFWLDVLEWGPASPFARWFDIDWRSPVPGLAGKVLAPFLADHAGAALAAGDLALRFDAAEGGFAVWAHDAHKLPLRPEDYAGILAEAGLADLATTCAAAAEGGPGEFWAAARRALAEAARAPDTAEALDRAVEAFRDPAALGALIAQQRWRACKHSFDREAINYRRFFLIDDLAGLRVEEPAVFDAIHGLLVALIDEGLVDGLRIDHIDGLRDPKAYLRRLRAATRRPFHLHVEKILAFDERIRADWGVEGSTGYEFPNLALGLMLDPAGAAPLSDAYCAFTGCGEGPAEVVRAAKVEIMTGGMAPEIAGVARRLRDIAQADPASSDLGLDGFRRALVAVIAGFDVYRTYADAQGLSADDRLRIDRAVAAGRAAEPALDPGHFDLIAAAMRLERPGAEAREVGLRLQQITGPVTAKGLEDTALYRFNRLIALNEVGSEPGRFGLDLDAFHAENAERARSSPRTLLATSTHDTKRGEDARMRIAAITCDVASWEAGAQDWRDRLQPEAGRVDSNELWFFFQLLLGAWPIEWDEAGFPPDALAGLRERVSTAMLKSVREAARATRWIFGDPMYEAAILALVDRALDPRDPTGFLASFRAVARRYGEIGRGLSIVQTALKLTVPGVPDLYQGSEFWDQSLVDPDNRRPVDFVARSTSLGSHPPFAKGMIEAFDKQALIARLLDLRRRRPGLFDRGTYEPVDVGPSSRLCAFVRRHENAALFVAADLSWPHGSAGRVEMTGLLENLCGGRRWRNVLDQENFVDFAPEFGLCPIVVLYAE